MGGAYAKRMFDVIVSAIALIVLAIPFLFLAIVIKLDSAGPVFFTQKRVGWKCQLFSIVKFRTMVVDAGNRPATVTAGDDPMITRIGGFLRKYKIDELPQLFNVLIGDMSIVGPRPEAPGFMQYIPECDEVFSVRPGLTDHASIAFVNQPEMLSGISDPVAYYANVLRPRRTALQLQYVRHHSVTGDIVIVLRTMVAIARLALRSNTDEAAHTAAPLPPANQAPQHSAD